MIGRAENIATPARVILSEDLSPREFLAACKPDHSHGSSTSEDSHFTGTDSYDEAARLALEGWPEGRNKVAAISTGLVAELSGRIQREEWVADVEGQVIDVGLYLSGEPECCRRLDLVDSIIGSARPFIRIVISGTVSAGVSTEVITTRGAAIAALADLMELAGYAVQVDVIFPNSSQRYGKGGRYLCSTVHVKQSSERLDLDSLTFWTAHPSALRRIAFARWEALDEENRRTFGFGTSGYDRCGYGNVCDPPAADLEGVDVYLGSALLGADHWNSPEKARAWIESSLGTLGVKLQTA